MMETSSGETGDSNWATVICFSVTVPSKMVPLMSLAETFCLEWVAVPRSGVDLGSIWPRWIWPSSWAMKRMRWVQSEGMMVD